ncbi:hypothetical protein PF008_g33551 [Phytophthora fragariae]|uniref:Secreted protein n=1 Tax=Phytophthora fragariae TaxID=53985 RepID=A0A6G0PWP8_9STRA|nr:hypothetical protein PF003_g2942 [Phytophthora fragariae]KAE9258699.1 hypothetical protein PF008_g33551 [Phytophthora fragariae]
MGYYRLHLFALFVLRCSRVRCSLDSPHFAVSQPADCNACESVSSITSNVGTSTHEHATASALLAPALTAVKLTDSIRGSQRRPTVRRHHQGP